MKATSTAAVQAVNAYSENCVTRLSDQLANGLNSLELKIAEVKSSFDNTKQLSTAEHKLALAKAKVDELQNKLSEAEKANNELRDEIKKVASGAEDRALTLLTQIKEGQRGLQASVDQLTGRLPTPPGSNATERETEYWRALKKEERECVRLENALRDARGTIDELRGKIDSHDRELASERAKYASLQRALLDLQRQYDLVDDDGRGHGGYSGRRWR